jgi:hypothetical protein
MLRYVGILFAALLAAPAAAQPLVTQQLDSGALVRLHLLDGSLMRGRLVRPFAADSQRMVVCPYPQPPCAGVGAPVARSVEIDLVTQLEIARTRAGRGALIGAGAGILCGFIMGNVINGLSELGGGKRVDPPVYALGFAVGGAVWGAVIGSTVTVWAPAP